LAFKTITPPAAAEARVVDLLDDNDEDEDEEVVVVVDDDAVFGAGAAASDAGSDVKEKIASRAATIRIHDGDALQPRCELLNVIIVFDFLLI